jgi:hypothetical protein
MLVRIKASTNTLGVKGYGTETRGTRQGAS